jgi:hypothetical protein
MNFIPATLAFIGAVGFEAVGLTTRRLQELGATPLGTFKLYRYALIPALVWGLIFVRIDDIGTILNSSSLLTYVLLVPLIWNIQVYLFLCVLNTTSSLSGMVSLQRMVVLPFSLAVGIFLNGDIPNALALLALALLTISLLVQPAHHGLNHRPRYSRPFIFIAGTLVLITALETLRFGLSREILKTLPPDVFVGIFAILALSLCTLWIWRMKTKSGETGSAVIQKNPKLAVLVPILWFGALVPETYAFAALPVYIVAAIATVTFGMDAASDLLHKRIRFNPQTAVFIFLFLTGTTLALISIHNQGW